MYGSSEVQIAATAHYAHAKGTPAASSRAWTLVDKSEVGSKFKHPSPGNAEARRFFNNYHVFVK
jgi:hypothetical protein